QEAAVADPIALILLKRWQSLRTPGWTSIILRECLYSGTVEGVYIKISVPLLPALLTSSPKR
ncbi:unnamed protein product, partial [Musa acuminata var. zebrina]